MKNKILKITLLCMSFISSNSFAWKIDDVFSGMSKNVTSPGSYQDQAAGYYTGGGFSARTQKGSFQPFSLTAPSMQMGCGGVDMHFGSMSMITGDELVKMAKNIATQAKSYGFQLAMKTFAPQIENLVSKLRDMAMDLNSLALEDCQAVQSLFAAALPKDSAMYENVCKDLERQSAADYFKSRANCSKNSEARKKAQNYQQETNNEVLLDNFNLFVIAATKAKVPEDMIEPTMSIAGTLIVKDGKRTFYDSLVSDQDTFKAHLKGGNASTFKCDRPNTCLNISILNNHQISSESSYQGKATTKLKAIKQKMMSNIAFTDIDKDFLTSIGQTFPIYNYISLEVVTGANILDKSSDLVANYMLLHYLSKIITEVRQHIYILEAAQINDQHFKEYLTRLDRVQDIIDGKSSNLMDLAHKTEEKARLIEQHHTARMR